MAWNGRERRSGRLRRRTCNERRHRQPRQRARRALLVERRACVEAAGGGNCLLHLDLPLFEKQHRSVTGEGKGGLTRRVTAGRQRSAPCFVSEQRSSTLSRCNARMHVPRSLSLRIKKGVLHGTNQSLFAPSRRGTLALAKEQKANLPFENAAAAGSPLRSLRSRTAGQSRGRGRRRRRPPAAAAAPPRAP